MKRGITRLRMAVCAPLMLLGACSSPVPLDWQLDALAAMRGYERAWFSGDTRVAEVEFDRARSELTRTGRADIVARAELARCALRAASLEFDDCPGYLALAADAAPPERAYAAYIDGRWDGLAAGLLPEAHRNVPSGAGAALAGISDPRSRLVAAGAAFKASRLDAGGVKIAVETASAQGWRRPLLAWLGVQERLAAQAGDAASAAAARRRIELVTGK